MNILVTGGSGFIGSRLVERLIQERHETVIVDRKPPAETEWMLRHSAYFKMDAGESRCLKLFATSRYDAVVHLACAPLPSPDDAGYRDTLFANLAALNNILHLSATHGVRKVIVLFDGLIYGPARPASIAGILPGDEQPSSTEPAPTGALPDGMPACCESDPLCPDTETGRQEQLRELCCATWRRQGLDVVSIRTGHIFDPGSPFTMPSSEATGTPVRDFLAIGDLVEAIVRTCENVTSPILNIASGRPVDGQPAITGGYVLDWSLAAFELEWTPVHRPEARLTEWGAATQTVAPVAVPSGTTGAAGMTDPSGATGAGAIQVQALKRPFSDLLRSGAGHSLAEQLRSLWHSLTPDQENILLFTTMVMLTFMLQYRLGIETDPLLLYIILANAFFGFRIGGFAIILAVLARLAFTFIMEDVRLVDFANDINRVMHLLLYLLAGATVGWASDAQRQESVHLLASLEQAKLELEDANELHRNSVATANNLRELIAHSENSYSSVLDFMARIEDCAPETFYDTVARTVADSLQVASVAIYRISPNRMFLRLAGASGPLTIDRSISVSSDPFWSGVLSRPSIRLNLELQPGLPAVCAPLRINGDLAALLLIDGIGLQQLGQRFTTRLAGLLQLISQQALRLSAIERSLSKIKYIKGTRVMRRSWFEAARSASMASLSVAPFQPWLFQVSPAAGNERPHSVNGRPASSLNRSQIAQLCNMIRAEDCIGQMGNGKIGIIMPYVSARDLPAIKGRLTQAGFQLEPVMPE